MNKEEEYWGPLINKCNLYETICSITLETHVETCVQFVCQRICEIGTVCQKYKPESVASPGFLQSLPIPQAISSDITIDFISKFWQEVLKLQGVDLKHSSFYHLPMKHGHGYGDTTCHDINMATR